MPFAQPCWAPEFFFDAEILKLVAAVLGTRLVADQWGCDIPLRGSDYQQVHVDYRRPLFEEVPDLQLPAWMLVVSFGLVPVTHDNGPIEIAPATHRMPRAQAAEAVASGQIPLEPVLLEPGDVLIRNPWALHRGTPNRTDAPRPLVTVRYVRRWYMDDTREVNAIGRGLWQSLTEEQRGLMRFPVVE